MERTIDVPEWMADFIGWVNAQGEDKIRESVRQRLLEIKGQNEKSGESRIEDGYMWKSILEPNDGKEQWKKGGDCTLCRKISYCLKPCRANKLLKKITTPLLYQMYLDENPEAAVKRQGIGIGPEDVARMVAMQ